MISLDLIPPQFKVAAGIAVVAVAFAGGWAVNGWRLNAKHDADALAAANEAKAQYDAKAKQYNEASAALEDARNEREIVYRTIEKRVEKIVERPVYRNVCIDADGLRDINDAFAGRTTDSAEPPAGMPAADSH